MTTSEPRIHFHRRSSVSLPSVSSDKESGSDSETEQESDIIKNSKSIVSNSPKGNSPVVIVVNDKK